MTSSFQVFRLSTTTINFRRRGTARYYSDPEVFVRFPRESLTPGVWHAKIYVAIGMASLVSDIDPGVRAFLDLFQCLQLGWERLNAFPHEFATYHLVFLFKHDLLGRTARATWEPGPDR